MRTYWEINVNHSQLTMNSQYVIITAAKDEDAYLAEVVQLVLRQTILPLAWVIIDDGSSDQTASIIERLAADHPFIQLHSVSSRGGRNFGSQYKALQAAYELVSTLDFEFVAIQDADLGPEQDDYYESMIKEFQKNPQLGLVSGFIYERQQGEWWPRKSNSKDSTTGSAVFRRACFDQIGGYTPLPFGGSDWLAQLDAKILGWEIATRPDHHIFHYRPSSSAGGQWRGKFRAGLMDASFGSHVIFELFKCARRFSETPMLIGGLIRFCGYVWWHISRQGYLLPPEKVAYLRQEQMGKLRNWLGNLSLGLKSIR